MSDMHEYDWMGDVTRVYREVIGEGDLAAGTERKDAFAVAIERLLVMTDSGELKIPPHEAIAAALNKVDSNEQKLTDRVLRRVSAGQVGLSFDDDDPFLDVVVVRGAGRRKPWRHVTQKDLAEMDNLRFQNVHRQQMAYAEWRSLYEPAFAVLGKFTTFEAAVSAGAFDTSAP